MIRALLITVMLMFGVPALAAPLVADLSDTKIDITTSFTGTRLLLFGALDGKGDVVVTVRGPDVPEVVRRKRRIAGVWVNGRARVFENAPGYYFIAASKPLDKIAPAEVLRDNSIGYESFELVHDGPFRDALIRLKELRDLYVREETAVRILGDRLFRTELRFPSSVPTGPYRAEVHLFRDGELINSYAKQLQVQKAGIEAAVFTFAHTHSALYGIIAVAIALFAGWLAGVIFRGR